MFDVTVPTKLTNAADFIGFMERVWTDECEAAPDGGVVIRMSPLYESFHNARLVAKRYGLKNLYATSNLNGRGRTYECENGDRIVINSDGAAVTPVTRRL